MSASPARVLFFLPALSGGGAERVMTTLLQHLDRGLIEPHLALASKTGPLLGEVPQDVPLHDLGCRRARQAVFKLPKLLKSVRPQVMLSALGYVNLLVMLAKPFLPRGIRFLGRETNIPSVNNRQNPHPRLFNLLYRRLYPRFDRVVCQSRDMRRDLMENYGLKEAKAVLIHNPVDAARISALAAQEPEFPLRGEVNLLAAGKLKHQKGFDLLLEALALLGDPRLHLTLLGEGPDRAALDRQARDLGVAAQVSLPGFAANPYALMARADLFVLSSRFEGFPNVLLEAGACGLPAAAFQCPGGIDEIIDQGSNGFLAAPQDPADLARTIRQALDAAFDAPRIRALTEERFGVAAITGRYQDLLLAEATLSGVKP